jgi:hypothetical protein
MLNFENAQVLALAQNSQFLGSIFRYGVKRELTVEGTLNNLTNFSGASGILESSRNFFSSDEDYQEVVINGFSFGQGRVTSINLGDGNDVQLKPYTANITCYLSGDYNSLFGPYYSGLTTSGVSGYIPTADFSLLESLSESFEYTRAENTFGYEHSVDLQFISGQSAPNPIQSAKNLARVLMDSVVPFGFLVSGDTSIGRKLYKESYDTITNQCSFTESYSRPINDSGIIFSITTSFNRDGAGISTITENGEFELATPVDNYTELNLPARELNNFITGSYSRCLELFEHYSGVNTHPLYTGFSSLSKNLIPYQSAGSYSVIYTNDPAQISGVSWEYTNEINKAGRFYNVSENGSVVGHGNPRVGYQSAKNIYPAIKTGAATRVYSFYTGQVEVPYVLYRTNEQKTMSEFEGAVNYSFAFTDNPSYGTSDPYIKTENISLEDNLPVQKLNTFNIFNFKEIVQPANNVTLGSRGLTVSLVGQPNIAFDYFKNYAKNKANEFIPSGEDTFLNSLNYSYNPNEKTFELSAGWTFFDDARVSV